MKLIYRLLKQNPDTREGIITVTSTLGIFTNLLIALIKIAIGLITSSIAIISEGTNNASDALSSLLTLVGAKLAHKNPDKEHPFGYGRIEYLVSLIISVLILMTGLEMLKTSVNLIIHPETMSVSVVSLLILAFSGLVKYFLSIYTIKMGNKADSSALVGVGTEGKSDCLATVITVVSSLIFIVFKISLDAYAGVLVSLFIIKAGYEILKETLSDLLGRPGEKDLADKLYKEIRSTKGIVSAADMMLHNYGPDAWSGSVNVEIDHDKTVGEIYEFLHELQLRIMHEYKVTLVFGVYAIDNDNTEIKTLRRRIASYIRKTDHLVSYHALYIDSKNKRIYCDFIVDYEMKDWEKLNKDISDYLSKYYPPYSFELTIETEYI